MRILFVLTIILTQLPCVYANEEYHHVLTLESPNPEKGAWYGYQVIISGDIMVVSEPYADVDDFLDAGKVYIYDVDGNLISTLQSPDPGNVYNFGWRLDLFGDTIIIKEKLADVDGLRDAGRAHVFTTDGTYRMTLQSPEPRQGGNFGTAGINDDIIVSYEDTSEGIVHMFDNEGEYMTTLHAPTPKVGARFGRIIEVTETLILLGECGKETNPLSLGSVYAYDQSGDHLMTLQAPEPEDQAMFGTSISVSGDLVVIGESYATVDGVSRAGRAYIFNTDGEVLHALQSPKPKLSGVFGDSVAIDGDRVVVGEWDADVNPFMYEGRAYVFDVDGGLLQNLTAPEPCPRAAFGFDVDIDGDDIVVGEPWADIEDVNQVGRIHVYGLGPPAEAQEPAEETSPVVEEEPETGDGGGIPGFPAITLVVGLLSTVVFITRRKL